jgi:hypothetical protein
MSVVISSAGSADGSTRSPSLDGPLIDPPGREAAPANRSPRPPGGDDRGPEIAVTSGLTGETSSPSASLQSSLESKLVAMLDGIGSPEYALTWKHLAMQSGPPILQRRAWPHRTSASEFSGWPTPSAQEMRTKDREQLERRRAECKERTGNGNGFGLTLGNAVTLYCATTDGPAELSPAHTRWLMGFPPEWDDCAPTAMPSSRRSPRRSSARS